MKTGKTSNSEFEFDFGMWLTRKNFYAGITANNLFDHKHPFRADRLVARDYFSNRNLTVTAGNQFNFTKINLDPTIAVYKQNK